MQTAHNWRIWWSTVESRDGVASPTDVRCPRCNMWFTFWVAHGPITVTHYEDGSHSLHTEAYRGDRET
jgi:hypothetical protein